MYHDKNIIVHLLDHPVGFHAQGSTTPSRHYRSGRRLDQHELTDIHATLRESRQQTDRSMASNRKRKHKQNITIRLNHAISRRKEIT